MKPSSPGSRSIPSFWSQRSLCHSPLTQGVSLATGHSPWMTGREAEFPSGQGHLSSRSSHHSLPFSPAEIAGEVSPEPKSWLPVLLCSQLPLPFSPIASLFPFPLLWLTGLVQATLPPPPPPWLPSQPVSTGTTQESASASQRRVCSGEMPSAREGGKGQQTTCRVGSSGDAAIPPPSK